MNIINMKRTALNTAMLATLGVSGLPPVAEAIGLPDGDYIIRIAVTPTFLGSYGSLYKPGTDGAWNSSFTFGGAAPEIASSNGMPDTGLTVSGRGSGVAADGLAGLVGISVSSNIVAITSFSKDAIPGTAGGDFVQYYNGAVTAAGGCGIVTAATSSLDFVTTGRLGATGNPLLLDRRWNVDNDTVPGATVWRKFTTNAISNGRNQINGAMLTSLGDVNSDGLTDFSAILVTGGAIGSDWNTFQGARYFEVWNVQIRSVDNSPAVVLGACTIPGVDAPPASVNLLSVLGSFETGSSGCSLGAASTKVTDGAAWGLVFGFLAWLRALVWRRKRTNHDQV